MKIILGSKSKGRRGVLESLGYEFEVMLADIDEKVIRSDDPQRTYFGFGARKNRCSFGKN